ncbi:alpha/beta hydrolase [Streptomyces coeruleorubidus]|uniref:alpha/beta hydrolase n=1 Tax=Streptomyces coeruleorubidus TaxID=116188 RepID=UPI001E4DB56C|nr:alpha/beta hydrolase [Streptomyces bellus]
MDIITASTNHGARTTRRRVTDDEKGQTAMIETVSFKNKAVEIAAHLHLPDDFSKGKKYPALVGIHPAGGVKEQTIGHYAKRLAAHGFVTVVYDSSCQGESGGEPRLLEDPAARVEDARCAADFLTTLPFVDTERIGVFGICAGGGCAISVAQTERRFKAVATVSAAPMGEGSRGFLGHLSPVSEQIKTLEMVAQQRTAEARGADPVYAPFVPETLEGIDDNTPDLLREGYDYYRTPRGQHPRSKGRFLLSSMDRMYAFSAFDQIPELLTQPMLLIAGSKADTKIFSDQAYELSNGPKELFVVEGATHIAMYDVPEYVDQAISKMVNFFAVL